MNYKKCIANIVENWNLDLWGQRVRKVCFSLLGIIPDMWVASSIDFVCLKVFFPLGSPIFLPPKNQLSKFQSFIFLFFFFLTWLPCCQQSQPGGVAIITPNKHIEEISIQREFFFKYFTAHCKIKSKDTDSNKGNTSCFCILMYANELL